MNQQIHFPHHRLDACRVALEALVGADELGRSVGRGYGPLVDQMRRASQSAYLQVAEGAPKKGAERAQRFRGALSEAGEAAAAVEALLRLGQVPAARARVVLDQLAHLVAVLTKLLSAPR